MRFPKGNVWRLSLLNGASERRQTAPAIERRQRTAPNGANGAKGRERRQRRQETFRKSPGDFQHWSAAAVAAAAGDVAPIDDLLDRLQLSAYRMG